jgi:hypothetical protein
VTRGTRLKKPSSSRGFAHEARGAQGVWGFWGLKIENPATTTKKYFFFKFKFKFFFRVRADMGVRADAVFTASTDGKNPSAG